MNKVIHLIKGLALVSVAMFLTYSCSKDNDTPKEEEQLSQAELKTILETDGAASSVDTVLAEIYMNDGSSAKEPNDCYASDYTENGFIVVFENCVLNGTDNVNGTLTVTYAAEGQTASFTANFEGFYVGDVELNGTRTYSFSGNETEGSYSFSVTSEMTATMGDGSTISENGTKTFGFNIGETLETSTFTLAGEWTLQANGNTYSVDVAQTLEGNLSCGYLTDGILEVNKNGLEVSVDFGEGSCEDIATVIYPNGATEDVSMKD